MRFGTVAPLALVLLLAGCGGNPFVARGGGGGGPVDPEPTGPLNEQLAGTLESVSYSSAGGGQLDITLVPFDAPPITATYRRAPSLDVAGYEAFVPVTTPNINRDFIAYRAVIDGTVAVVVGDGGRGVDAFGGAALEQGSAVTMPTTGLATYQGGYAGIRVQGDGSVVEQAPLRVTGDVEINADFDQSAVEGSISNRAYVDVPPVGAPPLSDRFLKVTTIDSEGLFQGEVTDPGDTVNGSYAGAFSNGGASVAGVVAIDAANQSGFQDVVTEYGVFALPCVADVPAGRICP